MPHLPKPLIDPQEMNFYLNYWKGNLMVPGDQPPVGLLLCTDKDETKVEYATGGLDQFPNATICISRRGWIDFNAPDPEIPQLPRHIIFPEHVLSWLVSKAASRIRLLPDEEVKVLPGITSWFCGAHHRSSMVFLIQTNSGKVALTDAVFKYKNVEEKIPLGLSESLEEHYRLYAKLNREADIVIPLYDPLVIERHKEGVIE